MERDKYTETLKAHAYELGRKGVKLSGLMQALIGTNTPEGLTRSQLNTLLRREHARGGKDLVAANRAAFARDLANGVRH